jgi:hypothetical protein
MEAVLTSMAGTGAAENTTPVAPFVTWTVPATIFGWSVRTPGGRCWSHHHSSLSVSSNSPPPVQMI